jgi:hypothetical protein
MPKSVVSVFPVVTPALRPPSPLHFGAWAMAGRAAESKLAETADRPSLNMDILSGSFLYTVTDALLAVEKLRKS